MEGQHVAPGNTLQADSTLWQQYGVYRCTPASLELRHHGNGRSYIRPALHCGVSPDEPVRRVGCGALSVRADVPVLSGSRCPVLGIL